MGLLAEIQKAGSLDLNTALCKLCGKGSCNIWIHSGTAEVLSDLVHNQHVPFAYDQFRHIGKRIFQKLRLSLQNVLRQNCLDLTGFIISILNAGNGKKNRRFFKDNCGHRGNILSYFTHSVTVDHLGPHLLAKSYGHHFAGTAFVGSPESIVGLQPAGNNNPV